MKILITGGCGYVGTVLIKKLLDLGHKVLNVDTQWFGNYLPRHKNLKNIKLDIRSIDKINLNGYKAVIHLASIANDNFTKLNPNISWEISCLGTELLIQSCKKYKIKRFIYASSGSVYGIRKERKVTETTPLTPLSLYNKVKMVTEKILLSERNFLDLFIFRPATVCGYSPRMRLDLTVNALTYSALKNKKINVHGGSQIRPNIHIDDITDIYIKALKWNKNFGGIYNCGFENLSVINIAKRVQSSIKSKILIKKIYDKRSYRLNSDKLNKIYKQKKNIQDAINELSIKFQNKKFREKKSFYSINWLNTKFKTNPK